MFKQRIIILSVLVLFALSVTAFAANPWIAVTTPDPFMVWQSSTSSMVPNTDPLTVWENGKEYMVVWDFVELTGNVRIDLLKDGAVVLTLSPPGGTPIGANGKGDQKTFANAVSGSGQYQVRVSSLEIPGISSISAPFPIVIKQ